MLTPFSTALGAVVAAFVLWIGGAAGLLYACGYLLALVPGLPFGWRLFGRRTPLGWVVGGLLGYGATALAIWCVAYLDMAHPAAYVAAWGTLVAAAGATAGYRAEHVPLVPLPAWRSRERQHWLTFLAVVFLFFAVPFGRVGERAASGELLYRSYFTADFVWHMAMTEELARFDLPPTNPYLAPDPIHYYWTYFLVPAALVGPEDARLISPQAALTINALGTAFLMFSLIFLGAWAVCRHSGAALAASLLALMAPSWEALYMAQDLWARGRSLTEIFQEFRQMNIDAVTNWQFQGLRIDGLVRSMWWTPQHATSFSSGLAALVTVGLAGTTMPRMLTGLVGLLLALSVAMNPFLGAAFCVIHGLVIAWLVVARRVGWSLLVDQWLTVLPVSLALGWTVLNQMGDGAGAAVTLGWQGLGRNAPIATMALSLGGLFVPALLALWRWWREGDVGPAWVAVPGVLVALALGWFVSLTDIAWVGFRAGNLLQVTLPLLAAAGLATAFLRARRATAALVAVLLAAGAPTTLVDAFNAQDLENRAMGPGFHWVIPMSPAQQAGFRWLRDNTSSAAVVQADPVPRGRENWSVIPSFAGRRMAAGDPISLLATPAYAERGAAVHHLVVAAPAPEAHAIARNLGIDYLWFDRDDDEGAAERLLAAPGYFTQVFRQQQVRILAVNPPAGTESRP